MALQVEAPHDYRVDTHKTWHSSEGSVLLTITDGKAQTWHSLTGSVMMTRGQLVQVFVYEANSSLACSVLAQQ